MKKQNRWSMSQSNNPTENQKDREIEDTAKKWLVRITKWLLITVLAFAFVLSLQGGCKDEYYKWNEIGAVINKYQSNDGEYNLVIICSVPKEVYDQVSKDYGAMVTFYLLEDPKKLYYERRLNHKK
jgi:hypothetical protein